MNELKIFEHPKFGKIRTITENGVTLFCGKDVAEALGYKSPKDAIAVKRRTPTNGGEQEMLFIPEGDIYRLAAKSELPGADEFEHWIFDIVLPSIRKHGAYMTPDTIEKLLFDPDTIIQLATALKEEQGKRKELEAANSALTVDNQTMRPKADYFDELVDRNLLTNFRETANELGVKERKFISALLDLKYIYRDKRGKLMPFAEKNDGLRIVPCMGGSRRESHGPERAGIDPQAFAPEPEAGAESGTGGALLEDGGHHGDCGIGRGCLWNHHFIRRTQYAHRNHHSLPGAGPVGRSAPHETRPRALR